MRAYGVESRDRPSRSVVPLGLRPFRRATTLRPRHHRRLRAERRRGARGARRRRDSRRPYRGDRRSGSSGGDAPHRRVRPHGQPRLHRHAQSLGLHDPRGAEVGKHDPAGRDDDGARRVAIGRTDQGRQRRGSSPRRRGDGRLDDAWRVLREARTAAHVHEHRLVRRRGTGLDLRQRLRRVPGHAGGARRDEAR